MSNIYRYILLGVSIGALVASGILAVTPVASRAQLTWQGSYVTSPRPVEEPRLVQGHGAAPEVLLSEENISILWQFFLGIFLIFLGFAFHAFLLQSHEGDASVRVRAAPRRRVVTCYWYRMRI